MMVMHRFEHPWAYGPPGGNGFFWWPGMLLSVLSTLFWIALLIGLVWAILSLLMPSIRPLLTDIFGTKSTGASALEILRQRYAAGEIDTATFEQMRERLMASYQQESHRMPQDDFGYHEENFGNTYTSSTFYGQGKARMAEQGYYTSENEMYYEGDEGR
jgi:putative membrane protein